MSERPELNELVRMTGTAIRKDLEAIQARVAKQKKPSMLDEMTMDRRRKQYAALREIWVIYNERVAS